MEKKWREKAKEENPFVAAGTSNFAKEPVEFLHNLNYIVENLQLERNDVILDVGCNTGLYCVALTHWVKEIRGIDYIPELVKRAIENTKYYPNIEIRKGDILNIPFETNFFNKILVNSVIHYLEDIEDVRKAFIEIRRVIKRGGRALISLIPDATKKKEYLDGVWKLDLSEDKKREIYKKNETALWLCPEEVMRIAYVISLKANVLSISKGVWQSWYMFNVLLKRDE